MATKVVHDKAYKKHKAEKAAKKKKAGKNQKHPGLSHDAWSTLMGGGGLAPAVKKKATPGQWAKIQRLAREQGQTVNSFLDTSTPDALKQNTRAGLQKRALDTVNASYAPAETNLDQQEVRIKALNEKRSNDNKYYNDWLNTKQAQLNSSAQTANAALQSQQQAMMSTAQQWQGQQQAVQQQAQNTPGGVTNPQQSTAIQAMSQPATAAVNQVAASGQRAQADIASNTKYQAALQANNFASMAASEAKRVSDTWASLKDVADERTKVKLEKGAKAATEVSRLLDQEITKASNNRDFAAAAQKLEIDAGNQDLAKQKLGLEYKKEKNKVKTDKAELDETAKKRQGTTAKDKAELRRKRKKDASDQRLDKAKLRLKRKELAQKKAAAKKTERW